MSKKQSSKRQFDWTKYSKPARLLTEAQESAFSRGLLAPVLAAALADPLCRFEIRARAASLYYRGASLARISGEGPFLVELEAGAEGGPVRSELTSDGDVANLVEELVRRKSGVDTDVESSGRNERSYEHALAATMHGDDLYANDYVVVDIEYTCAKRRVDLIALRRSEGVTGPGGFANPELAFIDLRCPGQSLTGQSGLASVAADIAEYTRAVSGAHLATTADEITDLVGQKVRLGLLPPELEVRNVPPALPQLLVAFTEFEVAPAEHDAAIVELHDRLTARHYTTDLLRFADFPLMPERGDVTLALGEGDAMTYREFKAYRQSGR